MLRVKQLMGFLLLASLLCLLAVLGAERAVQPIVWTSCFLLALSLACWMKGAFIIPTASIRARLVSLVLLLGPGWYFIGEKFAASKAISAETNARDSWQPFTPELLESELKQGHPVFVDFTAAWCVTCKFNEASVLETSAVRDALRRHGITKTKADGTNADSAVTRILKQFGRAGVPMYVLYPGNHAEPILFPELLTQSLILEKLETVVAHVGAK